MVNAPKEIREKEQGIQRNSIPHVSLSRDLVSESPTVGFAHYILQRDSEMD